ncbi:MAG: hypothetical protein JXL97_08730 [Bacteroidales bacterium]|nr:hypothetical protein [Bacteroidales bacterium]
MKGKQNFVFKPEDGDYVVSLKDKKWWWLWLLLLLLPLLLLIPFKKDVTVKTVDAISKTTIPQTDVFFEYVDYQMINFKTMKFFTHDTISLFEVSDTAGMAYYKDIHYTLYSLLLFANKKAEISGTNDCFFGDSLPKFHKLKKGKVFELFMSTRVYNYDFKVVNFENEQPIAGAKVVAIVDVNGEKRTFEGITEPDGTVFFENYPYCGFSVVIGSAYGYYNDTIQTDSRYIYGDLDSNRTLRLRPEKKLIDFFVKDLNTKHVLAGATGNLIIDGQTTQTVQTNINGYGAFAEEVHVLKDFTIQAQKPYYADTTKSDKVDHWVGLPDSAKTLFLRPLTKTLQFRNTDGSHGLPGVKNIIYVNGQPQGQPVYSNSDGYFSVSGVKPSDKISIVASKAGYNTNDFTVKNDLMEDLMNGPQSGRDIPLTKREQPTPPPPPPPPPPPNNDDDPPPPNVKPCEAPQESGGQGVTINTHSIGNSGKFTIYWDMYNVPDQLIVYCGTGKNKKQIFTTKGPVSNGGSAELRCSSGYITVKLIGPEEGTQWKYSMKCN